MARVLGVPPRFLFWQSVAFTLLGVAIMRLMLFFTPSYCLLAGLLASGDWYQRLVRSITCAPATPPAATTGSTPQRQARTAKPSTVFTVLALIVGVAVLVGALWAGRPVLTEKLASTRPRASIATPTPVEANTLELMHWLESHTPSKAVVTSSLALSSTIRISTGRRLAIHPHAEDAGMRRRYRAMYTVRVWWLLYAWRAWRSREQCCMHACGCGLRCADVQPAQRGSSIRQPATAAQQLLGHSVFLL